MADPYHDGTHPAQRQKDKKKAKSLPLGLLLQEATAKVQTGDHESAVKLAERVLDATGKDGDFELAALNLLGLAYIEMGDVDLARPRLLRAVEIDADGSMDERGRGRGKIPLARADQRGRRPGQRGLVRKGAAVLRRHIQALSEKTKRTALDDAALEEKRQGLAGVLCAVAEVYMTDLSWEEDAEQRCEALVTEATMACPESPETWQTVANVRISQQRVDEAKTALRRSMELWQELPIGDLKVPEFATRISLARLLMEVEVEPVAMEVIDRLVAEDDESVETWYLGGWCQYIQGEKKKKTTTTTTTDAEAEEARKELWTSARRWLRQCLKLYKQQDYEDDRLGEHARELTRAIDEVLGPSPEGEDDDEDDVWEDDDDEGEGSSDDEDEEMG
ncbi:unnamed protein product [Parascedosporium putredinis]|uniref:TPR domain-containing protein n=1 Tax=Parascedosporium putredinis TaxID=1442378 RepID=A0A9P1MCZ6_9PEZI|nr:unnamed protein product [Parascedosporium putredinis]CAI7998675.1 unnamed protein product [Parascedosporium putredinis]